MNEIIKQKKKLNITSIRELGLIVIIIVLYIIVGLIEPRFFSFKVVMSIMMTTTKRFNHTVCSKDKS